MPKWEDTRLLGRRSEDEAMARDPYIGHVLNETEPTTVDIIVEAVNKDFVASE